MIFTINRIDRPCQTITVLIQNDPILIYFSKDIVIVTIQVTIKIKKRGIQTTPVA